ncbi:MAG: 3-dehydroquinate synthase, partial [Treponema sp.]|nr:3-dehydroquinate synthase [Treponema sp.]
STDKGNVVHRDFKEKGERAFLNLGHTFGHALESVAGLGQVTHGEAVAWGISRALDLSCALGLCSSLFCNEGKDLMASFGYETAPLPKALSGIQDAGTKLLEAMRKDKKNASSGKIRVILQHYYCDSFITEAADSDILSVLTA